MFSSFVSNFQNEKCQRMINILSKPLIDYQVLNKKSFSYLSFTYDQRLISVMDAWSKVFNEMNELANKLKLFPGYSFLIGSIEPCIIGDELDGLIPLNDDNPTVEIERFFTQKYLQDNKTLINRKAYDIFQIIKSNINEYQVFCNNTKPNSNIYEILRYYFPTPKQPSNYGYPVINFVIAINEGHDIYDFVINIHLPNYIKLYDQDVVSQGMNDLEMVVNVIKNVYNIEHKILISGFPGIVLDIPIEIWTIFNYLNNEFRERNLEVKQSDNSQIGEIKQIDNSQIGEVKQCTKCKQTYPIISFVPKHNRNELCVTCCFCREKRSQTRFKCKCGKVPSFKPLDGTTPIWCADCKPLEAISSDKKCKCGKHQPSFNLPGETQAIWCSECKELGAINVVSKKCQCGKHIPTFNLPGEIQAIWCLECRDINAVDVRHNRCQCGKHRPTFNLPEQLEAIWCSECKDPNAIDVMNKRCKCGKHQPTFNLIGQITAIWCLECKNPNAIDVISKRCKCGKHRPTFNLIGQIEAIWCSECKDPNAINVVDKRCQCGKHIPSFNLPGNTKAIWCSECKQTNAIDIKGKRCQCGKHYPNFNLPGETKPIWCSECKDFNAVDVKHQKCQCGIRASYGISGQLPTMCFQHRFVEMISYPTKQCENATCRNLAIYGDGIKRLRCEEHKLNGDFNLIEKRCSSCGLMEVLNENNHCSNCEPGKYLKYVKRHENRIKDLFTAQGFNPVNDRIPNTSACGKERPDFVFDPDRDENKNIEGPHIVIVEVDEDQHKRYEYKCEKTRMFNVTQGFGGIPVFWIRYNPDKFRLPDGSKSTITQNKREEHLLQWVKYALKRPPTKMLEVIYLFYDDCPEQVGENQITSIQYEDLQ